MTRTLVTVATYNERENLPRLVEEIFQHAPEADLLVIDDNSPDGTGEWARDKAREDPRVHVLHRSGKQGLGTALMAGMKYAIEHRYEFLLNLDADFSHPPRYIPALLAGMNEADVMIGSRYVPGGSVADWPLRRRLMSRGVNLLVRWLLWLSPRDCSGGFRCYRVSLLQQIDFASMLSTGYSFQQEILWRLKRRGARIAETPIAFENRKRGQSKINMREAASALCVIGRLGLRNWIGI